jgi:CHAD domain-containing protein
MAQILKKDESLIGGIRRIASEIIIESIYLLKKPKDFDFSIHETRKNIKKLRTILRLLKFNIDSQNYHDFNTEFRDIGRKLSAIRDAEALIETIDKIKSRKYSTKKSIANTKSQLLLNKDKISSAFLSNQEIQIIIENLEVLEKKFYNIDFFGEEIFVFISGLKKTYSNCIKFMEICKNEGSDVDFHEWRKQVKYLWNSILLFQKTWNPVLSAYSNELHKLSDYLGDLHDISVLNDLILNDKIKLDSDDKNRLLSIIENLKLKLKKSSFNLGIKLFLDNPAAFSKKLNKLWMLYTEMPKLESQA